VHRDGFIKLTALGAFCQLCMSWRGLDCREESIEGMQFIAKSMRRACHRSDAVLNCSRFTTG
jgi:hypothetical protein